MFLDEKEEIVLEVAERARMVAQQDCHDFALVHLPFAVSYALISLIHWGDMDRSKTACNLPFFPSAIDFKAFKFAKTSIATFSPGLTKYNYLT